jgi:hypothetical protein
MSEKLEHNIMSLEGILDQEYVDQLGAPQELANTPAINDWMINDTYEKNLQLEYEMALANGREDREAKQWALKVADNGRRESQKLLKKIRQKRGY